jgi:hypothetical protein
VSGGWPREEAERRWFCVDEREMGQCMGLLEVSVSCYGAVAEGKELATGSGLWRRRVSGRRGRSCEEKIKNQRGVGGWPDGGLEKR